MSVQITDQEFARFQRFIYESAGITMSPGKKALISGRLSKRLQVHDLQDFSSYYKLLSSGESQEEVQIAIDLLTTNETYFFREPKHFELLGRLAAEARQQRQTLRAWSAASSSGEEAYSMAMVLADRMAPGTWEVIGSDISSRVLERARTGHYPLDRARQVPPAYLKRWCLRGMGPQDGTLLIERELREQVRFLSVNLNERLPQMGHFDVIFLRNVMIYFNAQTKREVVARLLGALRPGGYFCIGHSETLNDISTAVQAVAPSIYRKPEAKR